MENSTTKHLLVSGRVQGVCFRAWTRDKARKLGICGWVRNKSNGEVEALLQGGEEAVAELIQLLHTGPELALVESIRVEDLGSSETYQSFEIRY